MILNPTLLSSLNPTNQISKQQCSILFSWRFSIPQSMATLHYRCILEFIVRWLVETQYLYNNAMKLFQLGLPSAFVSGKGNKRVIYVLYLANIRILSVTVLKKYLKFPILKCFVCLCVYVYYYYLWVVFSYFLFATHNLIHLTNIHLCQRVNGGKWNKALSSSYFSLILSLNK